jgi:MFS family permease
VTAGSVAPSRPLPDGLLAPGRRALTLGLVLTITLVASESLAVSTVMPLVAADLGGLELYGWAFSAFFLGSLVGIVIVGGVLDRGGLTVPLGIGLALFSLGLLVGGLAPSMPVLVIGRGLQGLGAGAVPPIAYVAIARSLPEALRPRMFAVLSTAWLIPGVIGPTVAALIGESIGWRWVFLGLLPFVLVAAIPTVAALARVPAPPPPSLPAPSPDSLAGAPVEPAGAATPRFARDDPRRALLALAVAGGAAVTLAGLTLAGALGLVIAAIGLIVLVPTFAALCPPGTLRLARGVPAAVLLRGVLTFTFFCVDAYVPYLLVEARGLEAWTAGIAFTTTTLAWTGGAWLQARWAARASTRRFVGTGFLLVVIGIAVTATVISTSVPWPVAAIGWAIAGLGMGLGYAPLSLVVLRDAPSGEQGRASSALQLSDTLGIALGTGASGALVAAAVRWGTVSPGPLALSGSALGVALAFGMGVVIGVAGLVASTRLSARPTVAAA